MAIPGTGEQDNPYIVSTYADLISKVTETGKYVKLGNDIDVLTEYPDGDVPQLTISCAEVDGDGKTISRLYKITNDSYCVRVNSPCVLKNTIFTNIYTNKSFIYLNSDSSSATSTAQNCKFAGICLGDYFIDMNSYSYFKNCSVNVQSSGVTKIAWFMGKIINCNIKFSTKAGDMFSYSGGYAYNNMSGSYLEVEIPNLTSIGNFNYHMTCNNNVFDIITDKTYTFDAQPNGSSVSIWNTTHAPNITLYNGDRIKGVDEEHWLDTEYLASIGFNAYVDE